MINKKKASSLYFVENLTFTSWLFTILPFLVRRLFAGAGGKSKLYYINGSKGGILGARLASSIVNVPSGRLSFRLIDIRDDSGTLIRLRVAYRDLAEVQEQIIAGPLFQRVLDETEAGKRIPTVLAKSVGTAGPLSSGDRTLWRSLFLTQVALWKAGKDKTEDADVWLFIAKRPWLRQIQWYASRYGVQILPVSREHVVPRPRALAKRLKVDLPPRISSKVIWLANQWYYTRNVSLKRFKQRSTPVLGPTPNPRRAQTPKLAVEYYGHLDLNRPELKSDLFFWQQSQLRGEDILITFAIPGDPLDEPKWAEITGHGMNAVALNARATTISSAPVFHHSGRGRRKLPRLISRDRQDRVENRFLRRELSRYYASYDYWSDFFEKNHVKLYTTWYKYDAAHCAIADALQDLGGITTIYQRAYEESPSPETAVAADVVFGFSAEAAAIERRQHSVIPYYVVTGYNGDHRAALLREQSQAVRDKIQSSGASHILAFFDENSADDSRWHTGHEFMRTSYRFLLEKVLSEPRLGLVLKPKVPSSLRRRLADVADLLERAEKTGRCFVWEEGVIQGSYPPAAAALASDVAVHGHVCAATAGVEAALAGVPTLLMDAEGWPASKLYELGQGRVVFTQWQELWQACQDHWNSPDGMPGFGDWSPILNDLDPFRDGRAAERMGTYLKGLLDDLKSGLTRETALANAAERYRKAWGRDKIIEIRRDNIQEAKNLFCR